VAGQHPPDAPLSGQIPPPWRELLGNPTLDAIDAIGEEISKRRATEEILPPDRMVFRALDVAPRDVRVIIVGQDPYPTPGHATGLAFSVGQGVWPLPPTLKNILTELADDVGITPAQHGDLSAWRDQGVLLLNRHLTTIAHQPAGHQSLGWTAITDRIVDALVAADNRRVAILWGKHAQVLSDRVAGLPTIASAHPSPLSARRGFFGSQPFSRANQYLVRMGRGEVNWSLNPPHGCQPG
jgi:uracil-DNA glycosylase